MKGPNPVCTSARKKMNQSRPRRLWREHIARVVTSADAATSSSRSRRISSLRSSECDELANGIMVRSLSGLKLQWFQAARRAEHHDRLILLVFGRRGHLVLRQFERDAVALAGDAAKMQRAPVDRDLTAADAEEAAEIDDGRAHRCTPIDDHIDDAPHVLVCRTADVAAEDAVRVFCADDGDRGRWRRVLLLSRLRRALALFRPGYRSDQRRRNDRNEQM